MRRCDQFEEYDMNKLQSALKLLNEVCDYYYGYPPMRRKINRLETIIKKLKTLQNLD